MLWWVSSGLAGWWGLKNMWVSVLLAPLALQACEWEIFRDCRPKNNTTTTIFAIQEKKLNISAFYSGKVCNFFSPRERNPDNGKTKKQGIDDTH